MIETVRIGREIGDKLSEFVAARRMTQGQLAYKAKVSQATVSQLLNGAIKDPPIGTVLAVARALDLSLDQILGVVPMPVVVPTPPEGDLDARLAWLERSVQALLERGATDADAIADVLEADHAERQPSRAASARRPAGARKAK